MNTKKKQTAANNVLLARIKKLMNKPIFSKCSSLMNEQGEDAVYEYLANHFRVDVDVREMFGQASFLTRHTMARGVNQ